MNTDRTYESSVSGSSFFRGPPHWGAPPPPRAGRPTPRQAAAVSATEPLTAQRSLGGQAAGGGGGGGAKLWQEEEEDSAVGRSGRGSIADRKSQVRALLGRLRALTL